ncbi:MAG: hypothetical protein Rhob2KO_29100 [Rhodopirellula baltica]
MFSLFKIDEACRSTEFSKALRILGAISFIRTANPDSAVAAMKLSNEFSRLAMGIKRLTASIRSSSQSSSLASPAAAIDRMSDED